MYDLSDETKLALELVYTKLLVGYSGYDDDDPETGKQYQRGYKQAIDDLSDLLEDKFNLLTD